MTTMLSTGSIERLLAGSESEKPVVQILSTKKIAGSGERCRLIVSDGVQRIAMLATQLNHMVDDGSLDKYTIVRLENYVLHVVNNSRRILIIMEITVLESGANVARKIGDLSLAEAAHSPKKAKLDHQPPAHQPPAHQPPAHQPPAHQPPAHQPPAHQPPAHQPPAQVTPPPSRPNGFLRTSDRPILPISSLNSGQNRGTVRVWVTNKTIIKNYSNSNGKGKYFSMDLRDESGKIRATCFNEVCDKHYDMVEVNKLYYVSQAYLKQANKAFTWIKNEYEMSFNSETVMEPCHDQIDEIPHVQMNFVAIASLASHESNSMVDVIGVCKRAADVQLRIAKATNREYKKRDVTLVDTSNTEISLTLWDKEAEDFNSDDFPVIAIKGVKVSDFGGRSLSMTSSGMLLRNPNIPEAHKLRVWYDGEGSSAQVQSLSRSGGSRGFETNWKYMMQLKSENLGTSDSPDYFTCKAVVGIAKTENSLYQACPMAECKKKVVDLNNGSYRCEKCNKEFHDFKWQLILQAFISDYTDGTWVTCFQESAEMLLGKTAQELSDLKERNVSQFNKVFRKLPHKQFFFKLRAKMESFNDKRQMKVAAVTVTPVDLAAYTQKLIDDIQAMN